MKPTITAMMATYNASPYILESLYSVVDQDYPNVLIGVTDDCSTDNTYDVVYNELDDPRYVGEDDEKSIVVGTIKNRQIALIHSKVNRRQGFARNLVAEYFWGISDYFAITDSDDIQLPHKFSRLMEILTADPDNVHLAYGDYWIVNTVAGTKTYEAKQPYSKELIMRECCPHSNCVFSKKALETTGLFNVNCSPVEDYDLFLRISDVGMMIHVPEPLTEVRIHTTNSSTVYGTEHHQQQYQKMIENYQRWSEKLRNGK